MVSLLGLAGWSVRGQSHASTRDGVYTEAQAGRGAASYKKACASCHGEALQGRGPATPALVGAEFTTGWAGETVDDLFERIQSSMPADRPGQLTRTENADILAYILKMNKLPAGSKELPGEADALKQIQLEAAK